jgi:predicted HicB family RNase H-like nuclease
VQSEIGLYTRNVVRVPSLTGDRAASYRISLVRAGDEPDSSWLAEVDELPECSSRGSTPVEAVQRAWAAIEATSAPARSKAPAADGPAEKPAARHSGKLLVRMPATLHDELARTAEAEGVSLNQLITGVLASSVEWRSDNRRAASPVTTSEGMSSGRLTRVALAANLAAVLVAAIVAITLLVVAWDAGF